MCGQFNGIKPPLGTQLDKGKLITTGIVGAWFDQEAAPALGTLSDLSGNGHDGTLAADAYSVAGRFGNALTFDGSDSVNLAGFDTNPVSAATFVCWFKTTGTSLAALFSWGAGAGATDGIFFGIDPDPGTIYALFDGFDTFNIGFAVNDDVWRQYAVSWDGTTIFFYIDGILLGTGTQAGPATPIASTATLGIGDAGGFGFNCEIDHALFYDRALSASEIASLYREPFQIFEQPNIALMAAAGAAPPADEYTHTMIIMTSLVNSAQYWLVPSVILSILGASLYSGRKAA